MINLAQLKTLAAAAMALPEGAGCDAEDAAMKALHDWLPADTVLELIAIAERKEAELKAARAAMPAPALTFDDYPEYNEQAMGCGLEDRGEHDRYGAMRYGWDEAIHALGERIQDFLADAAQPAPTDAGQAQDERAKFEAWFDNTTSRALAWDAWKARAALIAQSNTELRHDTLFEVYSDTLKQLGYTSIEADSNGLMAVANYAIRASQKSSAQPTPAAQPERQPTAEDYSDMLRAFCCRYAAGGWNSEGLLDPDRALDKLEWIVDEASKHAAPVPAAAPEPLQAPVWVLTMEVNAYDQEGEYFLAVWGHRPSLEELEQHIIGSGYAEHLLETGGGRRSQSHDQWYWLRENTIALATAPVGGDNP